MYTATTIEEFHARLSGQERADSKLMSLLKGTRGHDSS